MIVEAGNSSFEDDKKNSKETLYKAFSNEIQGGPQR